MKSSVQHVKIVRVDGAATGQPDLLAVEEPLEIRLGYGPAGHRQQRSISVTMRTPGHDFELVLGFLFTEGIIQDYEAVASIHYCENLGRQQKEEEKENVVRVELKAGVQVDIEGLQRNFYTSSSCGVCGKSSIAALQAICPYPAAHPFSVAEEVIHQAPEALRKAQLVFQYTGGLHAAGLFDPTGKLLLWREDVGRHNAMDKLIGACLMDRELPLKNVFVLLSGRVSFELVQKALMAGLSMLAAVGAPSSLALNLAREYDITLLGFVRDGRFNIYHGSQRLLLRENSQN
jgi:FdhD protein